MAARGQDTIETNEISLKEKFFRYFQHEITGICLHHATPRYWADGGAQQSKSRWLVSPTLLWSAASDLMRQTIA